MGDNVRFGGNGSVIWSNPPVRVYYDDIRILSPTIIVEPSANNSILWSTGDTTATITVTPTQTTTYWVEQTENGVSCTDSVTVTINVCGCTDSEAHNYNIDANQDDGSCCYDIDYVNDTYDQGYADGVDSVICPENNCPSDLNLDGIVSTADLLMFLVSFGTICE